MMHLILAYAGMFIHVLLKLAKLSKRPGFGIKIFVRENLFSMAATFLSIPVILIMAADPAIKDILPINNVTAVLAGWQTNSTFKNLMSLFDKKSKNVKFNQQKTQTEESDV
ncbi:MAG: hypothetical protein BWY54_01003 [Candidatus Dependentiae bacterium ADurb.Bin331]|nr:MAG: hypothetical protein BWY54_01003 [Candidatus Dependentiae bacterium ADurb.Bin331]